MENPFKRIKTPEPEAHISSDGRMLTPDRLTSREKRMQDVYEERFGRRLERYVVGGFVNAPNEVEVVAEE